MFSLKRIFVSGCIFVSLSSVSFAAQEIGTIVANSVNVRKDASANSSVLFQLPKNESVKVLDRKSNWFKISYGNKVGWISDDFVKIAKTSEKAAENTTVKSTSKTSVKETAKAKTTEKAITNEDVRKVTSDDVNVRSKASTSASVVIKVKKNQKITVISTVKDWSKVSINGKIGWINNKFIEKKAVSTEKTAVKASGNTSKAADSSKEVKTVQPINGMITGDNVNVRKTPSASSSIVTTIDEGKPVKILAVEKDWTKISTVATTGWVSSKYVSNSLKAVSRSDNTLRDTRSLDFNGDLASEIIATGREYLGTNYVYGGTTPRGFDCSGFIGYIMRKHGIDLPRTSAEQATVGQYVSRTDLKPGDLLFFDTDGGRSNVSHVGMYIGNGQFIHASSGGDGEVRISSLSEHFYSTTYLTARRVIK